MLGSNDMNKWNELVERSQYASTYHLWEWGEALSTIYGYRRYYLAATQNDEVTGILPLIHVKSTLFGNRLISLPFCEYGGPLADADLNSKETRKITEVLLHATNNLAKALGVEYVEIRNPRFSGMQELLYVQGYNHFRRYVTFQVPLVKGLKELWGDLHKKTRNAVRKAMKKQVKVKEASRVEHLKAYYRLYLETQKRLGSPAHSYELFRRLYDVFHSKHKIRILLAAYQGEPIGGIIVFHHNKTIFWWNNVTDIEHRRLNPTNLLLWNTIEWGVKNGYRTLDLGRTRKKTTIYRFKSGWAGEEMYLQDSVYFLNSKKRELPDPEQRKYEYLSRVWAFMPISLTKKIGPKIVSGIAL